MALSEVVACGFAPFARDEPVCARVSLKEAPTESETQTAKSEALRDAQARRFAEGRRAVSPAGHLLVRRNCSIRIRYYYTLIRNRTRYGFVVFA
ncbi:MAG: hypothetical protein C4334_13395 [Pyrinomonas sp.]